MRLFHISLINIRRDFSAYRNMMISDSISISMFFIYLNMFLNEDFMRKDIGGTLTACLIASMIAVFLISTVFLMYNSKIFYMNKEQEYLTLYKLGMRKSQRKMLFYWERGLVTFISIITGLIVGGIFSKFAFVVMTSFMGVDASFSFKLPAAIITLILYSVAAIVSTIRSFHKLSKGGNGRERKLFLKGRSKVERVVFTLGMVLIGAVLFILAIGERRGLGGLLLVIGVFIGVFFGIGMCSFNCAGSGWLVGAVSKKGSFQHFLLKSELREGYRENGKIIFTAVMAFTMAAFFITSSAVVFGGTYRMSREKNPFDIAYSYAMEDIEFQKEMNKAIKENGDLVLDDKLPNTSCLLRGGGEPFYVSVFPQKEYNRIFKDDLVLKDDEFKGCLSTSQFRGDMYREKFKSEGTYDLSFIKGYENGNGFLVDEKKQGLLIRKTGVIRTHINQNVAGTYSIVVSDSTFRKIEKMSSGRYKGNIRLINLENWRDGENITKELLKIVKKYKNYGLKSMWKDYDQVNRVGKIIITIFTFIGVLFIGVINNMFYFKVLSGRKNRIRRGMKLYRIGAVKDDITGMIKKEILLLFAVPAVSGVLLGGVLAWIMFLGEGHHDIIAGAFLSVVGIFLFIEWIFCRRVWKMEYKAVVSSIFK